MGGQEAPAGPTYLRLSLSLLSVSCSICIPHLTSNIRSYFIRIRWEALRSHWQKFSMDTIITPTLHLSSSSCQTPHLLNYSLNQTLFSNVLYSDIIYSAVHTNDLFINTLCWLISAWAGINLVRELQHLLDSAILGLAYFSLALLTCAERDSD